MYPLSKFRKLIMNYVQSIEFLYPMELELSFLHCTLRRRHNFRFQFRLCCCKYIFIVFTCSSRIRRMLWMHQGDGHMAMRHLDCTWSWHKGNNGCRVCNPLFTTRHLFRRWRNIICIVTYMPYCIGLLKAIILSFHSSIPFTICSQKCIKKNDIQYRCC